jgi:hypothetical protein
VSRAVLLILHIKHNKWSNKMKLISKDGKTKDITRKELNIIKDEICFLN